jgi:hypothetical protein
VSDFTLKYILAIVIVVSLLVAGVMIQNWWDSRQQ